MFGIISTAHAKTYPTQPATTAPISLLIMAPINPNRMETPTITIQLKTTNHQYSERGARPLIVAYLSKQDLTDSENVII